jgi:hypothetical protein
VDWIHLAQDTYRWQVLVNMVMNLMLHKGHRDYFLLKKDSSPYNYLLC